MTVKVLFLENCANDLAGEQKAIDAKRAQRLARTGYVRILDTPEAAVTQAEETAARPRPTGRGGRQERRG